MAILSQLVVVVVCFLFVGKEMNCLAACLGILVSLTLAGGTSESTYTVGLGDKYILCSALDEWRSGGPFNLDVKRQKFTNTWKEFLEKSADDINLFTTSDPTERLGDANEECRFGRNYTNVKCLYRDLVEIGSQVDDDLRNSLSLIVSDCPDMVSISAQYYAYLAAWFQHPVMKGYCKGYYDQEQRGQLWRYLGDLSHIWKNPNNVWLQIQTFPNGYDAATITDGRNCAGIFGKNIAKNLREEIDRSCSSSYLNPMCELTTYTEIADTFEKIFVANIPLTMEHYKAVRIHMHLAVSEVYQKYPESLDWSHGFTILKNNIYFNETVMKEWFTELVAYIYNALSTNQIGPGSTFSLVMNLLPDTFPCRSVQSSIGSLDWIVCMFGRMVDPLKPYGMQLNERNRVQINTDTDYEKFLEHTQREQILLLSETSQSNLFQIAEDLKQYIVESINTNTQNTVQQSMKTNLGKLQSYFQSVATFDKEIAKADITFINSQIDKYNKRADMLSRDVAHLFGELFWRACTAAGLDIAQSTIKLTLTVINAFNPLKIMGGGKSSAVEVMDASAELTQAIAAAAELGGIKKAWNKLGSKATKVTEAMRKNSEYLSTVRALVKELSGNETSANFEKRKVHFITKYNDYSPAVDRDDLTEVNTYFEQLFDEMCDVIDSFSGTLSGSIKIKLNREAYCLRGKVAVQKMTALYEEMYDLQFDLMDSLADCVRASTRFHAATSVNEGLDSARKHIAANQDTDLLAELKLLSVFSVTLYNVAILTAKENYCNLLEYKEGRRPDVCNTGGTSIASLLSRSKMTYHSNHGFQTVPTRPSYRGDKAYIDLKELYSGKAVQFQVPHNQWLVDNGWITEDRKDRPVFVQRFEVYLPVNSTSERQVIDSTRDG